MTVYYVDDGGSSTSPYDTWAKAATSINALDTAITFASGDIVYFGHDHVCQATNGANLTITGPTTGLPTVFISATQGSSPPEYAASTSNQIDTSEGAYSITFDGSFALYGLCINSGSDITINPDSNETGFAKNCTFKPASNKSLIGSLNTAGKTTFIGCTIDCTNDTVASQSAVIFAPGYGSSAVNLTMANIANRTGQAIGMSNGTSSFSGIDISGGGASLKVTGPGNGSYNASISNVITAATWAPFATGTTFPGNRVMLTNVGPADAPTYMAYAEYGGTIISSSAIYRSTGATIEGDATSWLVTTNAVCSEHDPFYSPYIYGLVSSTGSRTFDVYVVNDTGDFNDNEVWLEVEYLKTADEAVWGFASDQRASITATPAAQTDDTGSTWNGSGPAFTYKQKLSVTATVNETGQFRARIGVGKASIAGSSYFHIDPKVTVT